MIQVLLRATRSLRRRRSTPASPATRSATSRARSSGWASTSRADRRPPDHGRMARPLLEVADVFRAHGAAWRKANAGHVSLAQLKVMSAIETTAAQPRSAAMSERAARTRAHQRIAYNSCRNPPLPEVSGRGCKTSTGSPSRARPSSCRFPTYHVVFTLPASIEAIAFHNKPAVYDLLFRTAAETLIRHDRGRPQAPRRAHRTHRRAPHLGIDTHPPSARPYHRPRRRHLARRIRAGSPAREASFCRCARALSPVPPPLPRRPRSPACRRPARLLRRPRLACREARLRRAALSHLCVAANGWSTPREAVPGRAKARSHLSRPLHPSRRDLEFPSDRPRRQGRHLQVERTTGSNATTGSGP